MRNLMVLAGVLSLGLTSVGLSCATKPRAAAESPPPPARIMDSAPEKRAALRAADPNIGSAADEERWGIEAAQERKRRTDEKNQSAAKSGGSTPAALPPTGPFDIRAQPQPQSPTRKGDPARAP